MACLQTLHVAHTVKHAHGVMVALTLQHHAQGLASEGQLATLTVEELKLYCSANGLVKGGKKADIIARIAQHLDG